MEQQIPQRNIKNYDTIGLDVAMVEVVERCNSHY
jgi:hypothetical protein